MSYSTDPSYVPSAMTGKFTSEKSGEGFGKKSPMPLSTPKEENEPYGKKQHK